MLASLPQTIIMPLQIRNQPTQSEKYKLRKLIMNTLQNLIFSYPWNGLAMRKYFQMNILIFISFDFIINSNLNIIITDIAVIMSGIKRQVRDSRIKKYSYVHSSQQAVFADLNVQDQYREPLQQTEIIKNIRIDLGYEKQNENYNSRPPFYDIIHPLPLPIPLTPAQYEREIAKLEQVICYLGSDKDLLKQQCASLQMQLSALKSSSSKQKQHLEAQIRKFKELMNDKISQCESIMKTAKKQKDILQQEGERIKNQMKVLIEKKNDEIFANVREKQFEAQQARRNLETIIEQLKMNHKKEISQLKFKLEQTTEQALDWKQKNQRFYEDLEANGHNEESQKLHLIQSFEENINDLKQKYHKSKMMLLKTGALQKQVLEQSTQIQRQLFLGQIHELNQTIQRYYKENQLTHQFIVAKDKAYGQEIQGYLRLINELQARVEAVYHQKQQQIELLKVKVAFLHSQDIKAIEQVYKASINFLEQKIQRLQTNLQIVNDLLQKEQLKNASLLQELASKDIRYLSQLTELQVATQNTRDQLQHQFERQKQSILAQKQRELSILFQKNKDIQSYQEQSQRLRELIRQKDRQNQQLQTDLKASNEKLNQQSISYKNEQVKDTKQWQTEVHKLKQLIHSKEQHINSLNSKIQEILSINVEPNFSPLQQQIARLKQRCIELSQSEKDWKAQVEHLKSSLLMLDQQSFAQINQPSNQQDQSSTDRSKQEHLYEVKIQGLLRQNQRLKAENDQLSNKITDLQNEYRSLDQSLKAIMASVQRRTELQKRIIQLGMDNNLVKNKVQLFP